MSRHRRLWWLNSLAILAIVAVMAIFPISALYSIVFMGKASALSSEWYQYLGHAAKQSASPLQHWFWRGVQFGLVLSPLSLWFGWSLLGRFGENIGTINKIEQLRWRRSERGEAEKRTTADGAAAARAREAASQNYPDYVSRPDLEQDEAWGDNRLVADLLDPPEVIIRYSRQSNQAPGEVWLYDRSRVASVMTTDEYPKRIAEVRQRHWEEEARGRRQEKIDRIEQQKRDELDRRQALQEIVYVS